MNDNLHQLRCFGCGARISGTEARPDFRCADCGDLFEVDYPGWSQRKSHDRPNPGALKWLWRERRCSSETMDHSGVWRFRELLPILDNFGNAVTLREGNTPLYSLPRAAKALGIDQLYAKHQGMNPTGSFKDTGMTAALSVARERGFKWVACASTGNTSAAMAAYAARAGMRSLVLIPEGKIAWGKLSQAMDYGALTCQLNTDFDGCMRVLTQIVREEPIYLLNSVNPYRLEGQKTPAFEIAEFFDWTVPDHLIVPGGNLGNSSALGKGFRELKELGLVARLPRISVIQAAGANPLVRSFAANHGSAL
jgi:threonine synthase